MKFTMDFEITDKLKNKYGEDLENQCYANFCVKYIEQLKDKLNYKVEKISTKKQIHIKNEKELKNELESINVDVYRFSMDLVNVKKTIEKKVNFKKTQKQKFQYDIEKMEENISKKNGVK